MAAFYTLSWSEDPRLGTAYAPKGVYSDRMPKLGRPIVAWQPIEFQLRDGVLADFQNSDLGGHICSAKLRQIIDDTKYEQDHINWIPVTIVCPTSESPEYYLCHIEQSIDVVDASRSTYTRDTHSLIKPVLKVSAIGLHQVFCIPEFTSYLFISETVKKAILNGGCVGVEFLPKLVC